MHLTRILRNLILLLVLMMSSFITRNVYADVIESNSIESNPFGCHRKLYTYRVTQIDENGHECWDTVSVWSCWGRCDSNEISDWKFPYKRSHHPVCVHSGRSKSLAVLRNCHAQADPATKNYEYMEAIACNCQACTSTDTSCEAPNQVHGESSVKILQLSGPGEDYAEY